MATTVTSDISRLRFVAGAAALLIVAELVTVPAVLACSLALAAAARLTRWRLRWLSVPAGLAGCWLLAQPASLPHLAAAARQFASAALAAAAHPALASQVAALAARQWRPPALAAIVLLATAQAGLLRWLGRSGPRPAWQPGLIAATRRRSATAACARLADQHRCRKHRRRRRRDRTGGDIELGRRRRRRPCHRAS